ncbi:Uncharacterised protein [Mycobacteroides abscessus subsp. massiliense]|uniref:hypothetical protein n=1 Tax=Mycobacteroides abscessus TaxID=36809 RepID=UPI0009A6A573|nr:hypothetical protein [Mycobacteroides abscessus]SKY04413.1 Uncharacterised protein [Mycobacteroides abscessus subsp. massiliense]SKZ05808.1 Uncharacterised protein [Mycobacteroides abscessus subsp. massiliense]
MSDHKPRYRFAGAWDEDGVHGYTWRRTVPSTSSYDSYVEVCTADADGFWSGDGAFNHYPDTIGPGDE